MPLMESSGSARVHAVVATLSTREVAATVSLSGSRIDRNELRGAQYRWAEHPENLNPAVRGVEGRRLCGHAAAVGSVVGCRLIAAIRSG